MLPAMVMVIVAVLPLESVSVITALFVIIPEGENTGLVSLARLIC
jgi:hypothetical protein